ncbi:MAG TPA: hypothetical protein VK167_06410 [Flavipsychrobacter sp.]|nr:hypothetical protein [Flavipsychrobacter sp.]
MTLVAGKKVLLVTNVNLACNPRCHKEVRALVSSGYSVSVLKFDIRNWSADYEALIEASLPQVKWIKLDAGSKSKLGWLVASIVSKIAGNILKLFNNNIALISYMLDKRSWLLNNKLQQIASQYDLLIAHNPGSFYPVYKAASKTSVPYAIDVEDYHPGEYSNVSLEQGTRQLMQSTLKDASYVSAAAPLILEHTIKDVVGIADKSLVINNVFPLELKPVFTELPIKAGEPVRLVWFSQNVGLDRGLDDVVNAMNLITNFPIKLTLIGNCTKDVKQAILSTLKSDMHTITFKSPMPEQQLMQEVAQHHIGLALEASPNLNRRICLTNKLFTYLLCGNAIIASDTEAQVKFMKEHTSVGQTYSSGNAAQLAERISGYYSDMEMLQDNRLNAYKLASEEMNWDKEQSIFIAAVNNALS